MVRFVAVADPEPALLADAASLAPQNPFVTPSFVASRRSLGERPWLFGLEEDTGLVSACAAFMRAGYLNRSVDITSLPDLPHADAFWRGLLQFCSRSRVSELRINSYASTGVSIPRLPGERDRRARHEYVLDLDGDDLLARITPHHRRNITRARKHGLAIQRVRDTVACESHTRLLLSSMQRRQERGEAVPQSFRTEEFIAMVQSGAGELFQAVGNGELLSSMLILRAEKGAYLQTAGTSPEGMKRGASHLMVYSVACAVHAEGLTLFNLGGAGPEQPGLQKFKVGFGPREVDLEAAKFSLATPLQRVMTRLASYVRRRATVPRGRG